MSYSFTVSAKDGTLTVEGDTPHVHVPDGRFTIGGHEEAEWLSLSVYRQDPEGHQVAQASSYAKRS
jgi:hypothetical protein